MEKGTTLATRIIERSLDDEAKLEIETLIREISSYDFTTPNFSEAAEDFTKRLSQEELMVLREYTGYNFKKINALLRNNWNYEEHGRKTEEEEARFREDISQIDLIVDKFPKNDKAFITYRGSTLHSFSKYGITSLEELICLKGKYLYEEGFTSTSLDEDSSYFNKEIFGKINNVETKYIIPPYSQDGMPLINDQLSYSPNQNEYIIERNSLSKVIDVEIKDNQAIITVLLIPKSIWNKKEKTDTKENISRM